MSKSVKIRIIAALLAVGAMCAGPAAASSGSAAAKVSPVAASDPGCVACWPHS
jgi:hypothetical protein